ncbi:MAG: low molecular weight protein-tyrosine-phosphatase [Pseudomonadota bacterium]
MIRILCVCRGNLCRSPMAAAALRSALTVEGVEAEVDTAGAAAWHIGDPAEPLALAVAADRGYDLSPHRARRLIEADFHSFDLILALDTSNLTAVLRRRPEGAPARIARFHPERAIDDPFYGDRKAFEEAMDLIEQAAIWQARRLASLPTDGAPWLTPAAAADRVIAV